MLETVEEVVKTDEEKAKDYENCKKEELKKFIEMVNKPYPNCVICKKKML